MRINTSPSTPPFRVLILRLNLLLLLAAVNATAQKEVEITSFYAKVYVAPSTNANFIGLTQKGERYPILGVRDTWYYIRFKNANGWVEAGQLKVFDPYAAATEGSPGTGVDSTVAAPGSPVTTPGGSNPTAGEHGATATKLSTADSTAASAGQPSSQQGSVQQSRVASVPSRRTTAREEPPPVKPASRLRSWFTQQNLPELPPTIVPNEDQAPAPNYFQVKIPTPVFEYLSPQAPILGMAKSGDILSMINEGDSWCRVVFADTIGWIEKRCGKVINPAENAFSIDVIKLIIVLAGFLVVAVAIVLTISILRKRRIRKETDSVAKKNMLIVATGSKVIQYTLTNGTTTIERCFGEVGFTITHARDLSAVREYLKKCQPDVVLIDHLFDKSILTSIERLCQPLDYAAGILVIVYNVPDPASMIPGTILPKINFLGTAFSDRDIFKLVTPLLRGNENETVQKSVQSSALAGNIGEGNLLEVLQFIEIGSKTGCLLIEMEQPFAIICFKNGRIIFAATADKITGKDAIFKVLDLKIGKFRFVLDKRPKESNLNLSTLEVLMEWAKAVDEAHEH